MRKSRYVKGDYNAICDRSGLKYKRSQMKKTWDGLLVGREWWDPKQPQLNIRGRTERISVRDARPRQPVKTVDTTENADGDVVSYDGVTYQIGQHEVYAYDGSNLTVDEDVSAYNGDEVTVFSWPYDAQLGVAIKRSQLI